MARAALSVLNDYPNGLAVVIGGGADDWANHADLAGQMPEEQLDIDEAVQAVTDCQDTDTNGNNWGNTLLVVTSDHECGHLFGDSRVPGTMFFDVNGNGMFDHGVDYAHVRDNGVGVPAETMYHSGGHTNALVPLFTKGACSEQFTMCVIGKDPNLNAIDNLDEPWNNKHIDDVCIYDVMTNASLR